MLNDIEYKTYYEDIKFRYLSGEVNVFPSPSVCTISQKELYSILDDIISNLTDEEKKTYDDIRLVGEFKKLSISRLSLTRNIKYYEEILISNRKQLEEVETQLKLLT